MKRFPWCRGPVVSALLSLVGSGWTMAKPPSPGRSAAEAAVPAPSPSPSPNVHSTASADAVGRWLLQQDGSRDAITLPFSELVQTVSGKSVVPMNPRDPADAAWITKFGGLMDRILPGMNKPESPAHVVRRTSEVTAFVEDALRAFASNTPGWSCPDDAVLDATTGSGFPSLRVVDEASRKSYYLGVALYPTGGRENLGRALTFDPAAAKACWTQDGAALLVAVEYNGKVGKDIAFLNWELLDLVQLPVRTSVVFQASEADVHAASALLDDGRKGRD